jgi:hypothetical protein
MRNSMLVLVTLSLLACKAEAPTQPSVNIDLPRTLDVSVSPSLRVVWDADGGLALEVSTHLRNVVKVPVYVARCPLPVQIVPQGGGYGDSPEIGCPTQYLAPGDTTTLTRVFGADTLASFAPGTYGVEVSVTTNLAWQGLPAGTIQLPLTSPY